MARPLRAGGLALALVSSFAFAMSGPLAKPLLDAGWSAGAAALLRIGGAALVLLIPTVLLIRNSGVAGLAGAWRYLLGYAALAVAGTQIGFFSAIQTLPVGLALLIEYTGPLLVVLWLWWRHGQRPTRWVVVGGALAMAGLVLILDPSSSGGLDPVGVLWAVFAAVCLAGYFVLSAQVQDDLPPLVVVGTGMVAGWLLLAVAAVLGLLPVVTTTAPVAIGGQVVPWWWPAIALVLVATVFAYLTGIAAVRRLGARLASFVSLLELVMATALSALLLAQVPGPRQLLGGVVILIGLVLVRIGEPDPEPEPGFPTIRDTPSTLSA
ncbi:MAG: EamA family transporter [Candidatus Nanopelagicales bacterium]